MNPPRAPTASKSHPMLPPPQHPPPLLPPAPCPTLHSQNALALSFSTRPNTPRASAPPTSLALALSLGLNFIISASKRPSCIMSPKEHSFHSDSSQAYFLSLSDVCPTSNSLQVLPAYFYSCTICLFLTKLSHQPVSSRRTKATLALTVFSPPAQGLVHRSHSTTLAC